jgi:hypothetical protein
VHDRLYKAAFSWCETLAMQYPVDAPAVAPVPSFVGSFKVKVRAGESRIHVITIPWLDEFTPGLKLKFPKVPTLKKALYFTLPTGEAAGKPLHVTMRLGAGAPDAFVLDGLCRAAPEPPVGGAAEPPAGLAESEAEPEAEQAEPVPAVSAGQGHDDFDDQELESDGSVAMLVEEELAQTEPEDALDVDAMVMPEPPPTQRHRAPSSALTKSVGKLTTVHKPKAAPKPKLKVNPKAATKTKSAPKTTTAPKPNLKCVATIAKPIDIYRKTYQRPSVRATKAPDIITDDEGPLPVDIGATCLAMGSYAGGRKLFKATLLRVRDRWPPCVVRYIADETGATHDVALPSPVTAYLPVNDISPM